MASPEVYLSAFQTLLERKLVRCRYLITKGAVHRLGLRDMNSAKANRDSFVQECHSVYKKAQSIMTTAMLAMESELQKASGKPEVRALNYWLRIYESCYESFLWLTLFGGDVSEIYKGPKFGDLTAQNISSVLGFAKHFNENPYAFAIPLDFTRHSCIADVLTVELSKDPKEKTLKFIECKEGVVNDAMLTAVETRTPEAWKQFFDKYGDKGVKQAERFFRAGQEFRERSGQINPRPGVYKMKNKTRVVSGGSNRRRSFLPQIENLCELARRGKYAVEIIDECLLVAALDATDKKKYMLAQFDARLLALNAFLTEEDTSNWQTGRLSAALDQVQFTDWVEGLGSVVFYPPLLRPIKTRTFLDLCFRRLQLVFYFYPPNFLHRCRLAGLHAGFLSKKRTNQLRANQTWRSQNYPLWEGRAMTYMVAGHPMTIGSARLHEVMFNWMTPTSEIENIISGIANMPADGIARLKGFTEKELE